MKTAIITFHWATNYGAVLQAYALQEKFRTFGNEVNIIDYYPSAFKKDLFHCFMTRHVSSMKKRLKERRKDRYIEPFREKYFSRTSYFPSDASLKKSLPEFDCYMCGSDQIWNESFLKFGERFSSPTKTYFLDFVPKNKVKCAYAASCGATTYSDWAKEIIKPELEAFDFISMREKTGVEMIKKMGIENCNLMPDPTLLWDRSFYEKLFDNSKKYSEKKYICKYILHNRDKYTDKILNKLNSESLEIVNCLENHTVEEWIGCIKNADFVVTNSFHGTVFSILFHVPFNVILIENSGMNDRIITLLDRLGLNDRIISENGQGMLNQNKDINWQDVDLRLEKIRTEGANYIEKICDYTKKKVLIK